MTTNQQKHQQPADTPQVCDLVQYHMPAGNDYTDVRAAVVTGISTLDPHTVNLAVFSTQGLFFTVAEYDEDRHQEYTWSWPPRRAALPQVQWFTTQPAGQHTNPDMEDPAATGRIITDTFPAEEELAATS